MELRPEPFADAVRWPVDTEEMRLRLSDRLPTRLPAIQRRVARRFIEEPAGSRLRRWLLTRLLVVGFAASAQRDYDLLSRIYDPDLHLFGANAMFIDLPEHAEGWPALRKVIESWFSLVGELDWRPVEAIDLGGPHCACRVNMVGAGLSSGVPVDDEGAFMYELGADGLCVRQWIARDLARLEDFLAERRAQLA